MNKDTNALNWFEIPVTNMERAKHFYQVIFGIHMEDMHLSEVEMATFPSSPGNGKASGALAKSEYHNPAADGTIVYLNANPDMAPVLEKIEGEGGKIIMGKTAINPQIGYMAFFEDTEGNRIALHSQQ